MAAMPIRRVDAPRRRASMRRPAGDVAGTPARRPDLFVVPQPRAAANALIVLVAMIAGLMLAAVVLHTRLADRQLEIDRLEAQVTDARERFDVLRQQRAELRSPGRLAVASRDLGMHGALETSFIEIDSHTLAQVLASTGTIDEATGRVDDADPLEQIQRVRTAGEP